MKKFLTLLVFMLALVGCSQEVEPDNWVFVVEDEQGYGEQDEEWTVDSEGNEIEFRYQEDSNDIAINVITIFFGLVIAAFGYWSFKYPESSWQFGKRWQFKNAEPTEIALGMTVFGGVVGIVFGIIMIVRGLFGVGG